MSLTTHGGTLTFYLSILSAVNTERQRPVLTLDFKAKLKKRRKNKTNKQNKINKTTPAKSNNDDDDDNNNNNNHNNKKKVPTLQLYKDHLDTPSILIFQIYFKILNITKWHV